MIKKLGKLRLKMCALIFAIFSILWIVALSTTYLLYSNSLEERYTNLSMTAAQTVCGFVTEEQTERYINGFDITEYIQTNNKISSLDRNMTDIYSIAVYKMRENTMDVMFDTKTDKLRGGLGTYKQYDRDWSKYKEDFSKGKIVERMVANEVDGAVIYYCTPIGGTARDGFTYVCVGVTQDLLNQEAAYLLKRSTISLAFAIFIIFIIVAMFFDIQISKPLYRISKLMKRAAAERSNSKLMKEIMKAGSKVGNEIDDMYTSLNRIYTTKVRLNTAMTQTKSSNASSVITLMNRMDEFCASHMDNTVQYAIAFINELRKSEKYEKQITAKAYDDFVLAVPIHDIGKLLIPDYILNKPGKHTDEEKKIMREHTIFGTQIIDKMSLGEEDEGYLKLARQMALSHHEKWNGEGYPEGKKGEEIPLLVRIMQITDVLDALLSERRYKKAMPFDEAFKIVVDGKGTDFDPELIDELIKIEPIIRDIHEKISENTK